MRLIDADKLTEELGKCFYDTTNHAARRAAHDAMALCQNLIDEQPTAYDVDKVVERLEDMQLKREEQLRACADNDIADHFRCKMSAIAEVIEIVKSGGVR